MRSYGTGVRWTEDAAPGRAVPAPHRGLRKRVVAGLAVLLGLLVGLTSTQFASAATNPYQRGPDPTLASVAASRGPFATAQLTVSPGNGFNGGFIYYPTDTSLGTWGAVAIVPGYTAKFANEEAWMGPWLASFGFVVIGIETNSTTDFDTARGTELLAALDWLTRSSPVRDRVDSTRLGVIGHSMGGGGALSAATRRPSLKSAVGLAPYFPSGNLSADRVPTMIISGQNDTVVTPSYLDGLYATMPRDVESAHAQLAGQDHLSFTRSNPTEMRILIPWLKTFIDSDTRYTQFLCPLADSTGVSKYTATCPLVPPGFPTPPPTTGVPTSAPPTSAPPTSTPPTSNPPTSAPPTSNPPSSPPPADACSATYKTTSTWPGGFQGEVTVTAGSAPINGWTTHWTLGSGQSITQIWNGTLTTSGSSVTVKNVSYNGSLAAGGSATFGFLANGTASTPTVSCTSP